ncbi:MAG: type IV secretion system protein [Rickettsiales bacterium]|nr:type IV secretion system protein [Rickettsiales bacterium]
MWRKLFQALLKIRFHETVLQQIAKFALIIFLLIPTILPSEAYAIYDAERDMHWSSDNRCRGGGWNEIRSTHSADDLNFNPFGSNQDIDWELTNGVCATYISTVGAALFAQEKIVQYFYCVPSPANLPASARGAQATNELAMGPPLPPYPNPGVLPKIAAFASVCGTAWGDSAVANSSCITGSPTPWFCSSAAIAASDASRCCSAVAAYSVTLSAAVSALAIIYGVANGAYKKARICGYDWQTWNQVDENDNPSSSGTWKKGAYDGSYKKRLQDMVKNGTLTPDIKRQEYREYIFGGEEKEDKGAGACSSPKWSRETENAALGYHSDNLKYYVTGPNSAPIFACYRYLIKSSNSAEVASGQSAYECCTKRSQSVVCIENAANVAGPAGNNYEYSFCEVGSRCNVKGVWFDAYKAKTKDNYVCAKTYSGCPYNHPVGGGTEKGQYDDSKPGEIVNDCQYMNHCSILPIKPYIYNSSLSGDYFDSSCRDMVGDSQNVYSTVVNRGFSAPMAQCFKETMENIFFNQAGATLCNDGKYPDSSGSCKTGYKYKKGDDLSSYQRSNGKSGQSFFVQIQTKLQNTIKMALSIAIMFLGISVLIGSAQLDKKQLITFALKIGLVMYFATGNEWQGWLVDGIIRSSSELSDLMFRTDAMIGPQSTVTVNKDGVTITNYVTIPQEKLDGCQFPRYNYAISDEATRYDSPAYPPGKEYLRIWDILDCKLGRAIGYGVGLTVPNLAIMVFAGIFTGGAGVIFFIATFAFAFFLFAVAIRALHIFLLSVMSIIILFYVSPIMITLAMFNKTKGIFDKWWKNILSFALQPMILFAYLGILLTMFDNIIMGDVTFVGDGKLTPKEVVCEGEAVNSSIYCIFNPQDNVKTDNRLKMLGVGLPILANINQAKVSALIKAALIFFIFTEFLDKISDFAKTLTGGDAALSSKTPSAAAMMSKAGGLVRGFQKRGIGALRKNVGPAMLNRLKGAKKAIRGLGDGGRSAKSADIDKGSNNATRDD